MVKERGRSNRPEEVGAVGHRGHRRRLHRPVVRGRTGTPGTDDPAQASLLHELVDSRLVFAPDLTLQLPAGRHSLQGRVRALPERGLRCSRGEVVER